jgi:hypothetical protein
VSDFDPGATLKAVDDGAERLEKAAESLHAAVLDAEKASQTYDEAYEKELLRIYDEAKKSGERMPAEDVRRALAHHRIESKVYIAHVETKAKLAAQEKLFRGLEKSVSARQSVLKLVGAAS